MARKISAPPGKPMNIISLGAGVQSSTMALMAAQGEITPMPDAAIFADTQCESSETYEWLDRLKTLLPFPTYVVTKNNLADNLIEHNHSHIPAFMYGDTGITLGKRQCTTHWKIRPVQREIRRLSGTAHKHLSPRHFTVWHGISTDEATRMKDSRVRWIQHRWPLIENNISRDGCLEWLSNHGINLVVKSACVFCPYQKKEQWKARMLKGGPEWAMIQAVEKQLLPRGEYLTPECLSVSEYVQSKNSPSPQLNLLENECEGMCGV